MKCGVLAWHHNVNDSLQVPMRPVVIFSNKNLNKIANPYFTTKVKGTGLGLAIVNKIINDHDGKINFKPKPDGARVEIILPKNVS